MDSVALSPSPWPLLATLLGPFIGSFLGLLSVRLPQDQPVVFARSACSSCGVKLSPIDLIPLLSFALQRGRCRVCAAPIDRRYPLIELACAGIGLWAGLMIPGPEAFVTAALGWALLLIAIVDAEHFWLPDRFTLPLLAAGLLAAVTMAPETLTDRLIGAVAGFASLAALAFVYKRVRGHEGLGGGDPRLLAAAGAWVGWMGLPSVLLWACVSAFSVIAAQAIVRGGVGWKMRLPLGTHLALGLWLTWLYGPLGLG